MIRMIILFVLMPVLSSCMSAKKKIKEDAFEEGDTPLVSEDKTYFSSLPKKKSREAYLDKIKKKFEENQSDLSLLLKLMDAHFFLENYREAYKYGKRALAFQQNLVPIRLKLAHITVIQGRLSYARHILSSLDCKSLPECLNIRGMLEYKSEDVEGALANWRAAQELDSDNIAVALNLASFYLEFYQTKKALSVLEGLSLGAQKDTNVEMLATIVKTMPKQADEAEDVFELVQEKHKFNPLLLHNLALAFMKQEDYDDALDAVKKSLKYAPRYNLAIDRSLRLEAEIKRLRDKDD